MSGVTDPSCRQKPVCVCVCLNKAATSCNSYGNRVKQSRSAEVLKPTQAHAEEHTSQCVNRWLSEPFPGRSQTLPEIVSFTEITSCVLFSPLGVCVRSKRGLLWEGRIIRDARNKNRSPRRPSRCFHFRSLRWLPPRRAQHIQTNWPGTFPAPPPP